MSPMMYERLWQAFLDTIAMVGVSCLVAVIAGIPLAVFLVLASPGGLINAPNTQRALAAVIQRISRHPVHRPAGGAAAFDAADHWNDHRRLGSSRATLHQRHALLRPHRGGQSA